MKNNPEDNIGDAEGGAAVVPMLRADWRRVHAPRVNDLKQQLGLVLQANDEERMRAAIRNGFVPKENVDKLRAWLQSNFPDIYHRSRPGPRGSLRILLDENIPYQIAPTLDRYGHVSSVILEGWRGKKDRFIYPYAELRGRFDAIITRDKSHVPTRDDPDLTFVALNRWRDKFAKAASPAPLHSPVLVHLPTESPYKDGTMAVFTHEVEKIRRLIRGRAYAVIQVTPSGVSPIKETNIRRLWREAHGLEIPSPTPANLNRQISDVDVFSRRIAGARNVELGDLMEQIKAAADTIFEEMSMTNSFETIDDVLVLLGEVVERVRPQAGSDESLMVVEMAVRSLRKLEYLNGGLAAAPGSHRQSLKSNGHKFRAALDLPERRAI